MDRDSIIITRAWRRVTRRLVRCELLLLSSKPRRNAQHRMPQCSGFTRVKWVPPVNDFGELVARVRQGDERATTELVVRYERLVRRSARRFLGPKLRPYLDSVDVAQSVYRTLLLGLRHRRFNVSTPNQLAALALVLVKRKVARQWRSLRHELAARQGSPQASQLVTCLTHCAARRGETPAEVASRQEELSRMLQRLPVIERQLIELRLQGFTTAEAAAVLEIDPALLRVRLHRLRRKLQNTGLFRVLPI
ncbi:MAG: sigma-70 family RNA polymerase sigma factor [Pirellulales bacterium]|nr:sigma-70 family RNA polymerase sigma factor [Pirellulales bacterium]